MGDDQTDGGVHGQFAARAHMQTLSRNPAIVVPSVIPSFSKRLSLANKLPTWHLPFIVAPQSKALVNVIENLASV